MTVEFPIVLKGEGEIVDEAWRNAIEAFNSDPGVPPDNFTIEDEGIISNGDTHAG